MRKAVSFAGRSVRGEREDCALSHEMRGGVILVQIGEDGSEFVARMQFLGGRRIFSIHENNEVRVRRKERHLTFRIATVGAMGVSLDEFSNRQPVRGFTGGDCDVFAHGRITSSEYLYPANGVTRGWLLVRETPRSRSGHIHGRRRSI